MTCRELSEFLMQYLSRELTAYQRAQCEAHLLECPACVTYCSSYEETVRLEKAAFAHLDEPVAFDVPEELVRAILAARPQSVCWS